LSTRTLRSDRPAAAALRASAWAVAALGFTLSGCTSPKSLGDECLFNADCADPLICAARRCRAQCGSDRDCPRGEVCAGAGQPGKKVCVQPQSAQLCAYNSDCSARSTCADGLCHAVCSMDGDCARPPPSNTCDVAKMICAEPDRVSMSVTPGDGGVPGDGSAPADASGDGGAADVASSDAPVVDVVAPMDAPSMDAAAGDAVVTDLTDATPGDGATPDVLDAAMVDVTDVARSDASDATMADVGDAAVLADGGMVCVGTPDLQNDLDNCGRCGNRCPRPSAGTGSVTCTAGLCVTSCTAGFTNCNGLCTDLRTDLNHCGRCGTVCEVGCTAGVCVNPVEIVTNWNGGALVRLSDDTWRGFGPGNWAAETGGTPPVFPWVGSREVPSPLPIPLTGQNLIPAHPSHLYRITATGTLQGIGANGSLGDGTYVSRTRWTDVPVITEVRDVTSAQNGIYSVSCAAYGTEGRVSCWGSALAYAYGNPMTAERLQPSNSVQVLRFDDQPLTGVIRVRRGSSFTIALRDNGEVWTWGVNGDGRLGLGFASNSDYSAQARRIPTLPPCTSVATGSPRPRAARARSPPRAACTAGARTSSARRGSTSRAMFRGRRGCRRRRASRRCGCRASRSRTASAAC
jgi:hypothetical protein